MARIMIVDDARIIRSIIKRYLVEGGHEVVCEAENGIEAIEGYNKNKPDTKFKFQTSQNKQY